MDYFLNIVGQENAVRLLKKAIELQNVSHAYIFLGPAGTGKMLCALAFAYTLIHQEDEKAPLYFREKAHPDILIIEKAENRSMISKDQIKQMESWFSLKPYRSKHRIVIIRDCHLMTLEAANAVLKILEEPPEYGIIILISERNSLLETILSRCQLVRFSAVPDSVIEKFLVDRGIDHAEACRVSRLGQGSISNALRFASEENFQEIWESAFKIVEDLLGDEVIEVFNAAEKMEKAPLLLGSMLETILRDICVYKETGDEKLADIPENIKLAGLVKGTSTNRIREAVTKINLLKTYYDRNINSLLISINISYEIWSALK
ncbi:MAG: DNA polymerase III subunit [Syntrophomonadaceae bacterium]|nr:DNA polymerase III subunit [Syntrophomonadaceae bacterium]